VKIAAVLLVLLLSSCAHGLREGQKVSLPDGRRGVIYTLYPEWTNVHVEGSCWACYEWATRKDLRRR
jgi:hypothetical protein